MILTSRVAISAYSKLEDTINEYLIKNKFRHFETFINNLKLRISYTNFGAHTDINIDIVNQQIEIIIDYQNAMLYMNILFVKDEDVLFIHYTDSVYVVNNDGTIKQDILKFKNYI